VSDRHALDQPRRGSAAHSHDIESTRQAWRWNVERLPTLDPGWRRLLEAVDLPNVRLGDSAWIRPDFNAISPSSPAVQQIIVLFPTDSGSSVNPLGMARSHRYSLSVTQLWESEPDSPEWVYILASSTTSRGGTIACKTPVMMKVLLRGLPIGSQLDWHPRTSGEMDVLADHLEEMLMICAKGGVVFTVHD